MQLTETLSEGLKREFKVVLPIAELEQRLTTELAGIKDRVRINGFRPGKVPMAHLRRLYGRSAMSDVVQNAVTEANNKIVEDHNLRLALEPQIEFPEDKSEVEKALEAKGDLAFTVKMEILPTFEIVDLSGVSLTRKVSKVTDEQVTESLEMMAKQNRTYQPKAGKAAEGDRVVVDFVGTIDGEAFEGGSAEGINVDIGSETFIPGFEEQLKGVEACNDKTVTSTFPTNYLAAHLAGKTAEFAVKVKEVQAPDEIKVDEELAKNFGMDSLDTMRETMRGVLQRDYDAQARRKVKKTLLDALDEKYAFDIPPSLLDQEFGGIWREVLSDMKSANKTFEDEGTTEEKAQAEYRKIAERRVRLGLVLAEVGEKAAVKVADEEVTQALAERVRQYPGQERQVWDFYRKNPQALAEIRAPLFEEKVVDHILAQVKITDEPVSRDVLFAEDDEEGEAKPATKAAKGGKKVAKADASTEEEVEKSVAKPAKTAKSRKSDSE